MSHFSTTIISKGNCFCVFFILFNSNYSSTVKANKFRYKYKMYTCLSFTSVSIFIFTFLVYQRKHCLKNISRMKRIVVGFLRTPGLNNQSLEELSFGQLNFGCAIQNVKHQLVLHWLTSYDSNKKTANTWEYIVATVKLLLHTKNGIIS